MFFVSPKEDGEQQHFFVLGDPNATTSSDLATVGGMYECVVFEKSEDPEVVKQGILNADLNSQDSLRARCDLHFFCPVEHRDRIVAHLEASRLEFVRSLKLHLGDEKVGYATFKGEGYACGRLSSR